MLLTGTHQSENDLHKIDLREETDTNFVDQRSVLVTHAKI
jgi:hypothetical protein